LSRQNFFATAIEINANMAQPAADLNTIRNIVNFIVNHWFLWLLPAAAVSLLALAYAALRRDTWEASQSLVVRNEAAGNTGEPGRFRHADEMKTTQETILELVRSRAVLRQALLDVGPVEDEAVTAAWPTDEDVALLAEAVKLAPPKGAEFGKTEILYLKARDKSRPRTLALVSAISENLQSRFQELRDAKAQGIIAELTKAVSLAEAEMTTVTEKLAKVESSVGSDLAELRILHESSSGDSDLRRKSLELESELRQAQLTERSQQSLLELLKHARVDQGRLLAMPSRLLESQPALKRLKEGLVDAQLKTAELSGGMSTEHPLVRAALESEDEISRQLHQELEIACRGVQVDLRLATERAETLAEQLADTRSRLARLGGLRATYSNLITEVQHRGGLLAAAQRELSEARSSQAGAHSSSLIYTIDAPDAGTRPVGPGRLSIALGGVIAGLLVGAAVLFVSLPTTLKRVEESAPVFTSASFPTPIVSPVRKQAAPLSVRKALNKAMAKVSG
jgi:succinoglycan biosynthesis transport protein ExoP